MNLSKAVQAALDLHDDFHPQLVEYGLKWEHRMSGEEITVQESGAWTYHDPIAEYRATGDDQGSLGTFLRRLAKSM